MKVTIFGSGAWEGIPAPFCRCKVCDLATHNPSAKNSRTRPQFLFENNKGIFFVEMSPDIRLQSARFKLPPPTDVLLSHWHFDHLNGLRELHSLVKKMPQALNIYCSAETAKVVKKEYGYMPFHIKVIRPFRVFELFGISITPLPVYHMLTQDNTVPEKKLENTFAYLFESNNQHIVYLADYYRISKSIIDKIHGIDAVIADGTYLSTNKYKKVKLNHMHGNDILNFTKSLAVKKVFYHSISHLTHKTHEELQKKLPDGHFLTYDGMRLL